MNFTRFLFLLSYFLMKANCEECKHLQLKPCYCSKVKNTLSLSCEGMEELSVIQKIFKKYLNKPIKSLNVIRCASAVLQQNILFNVSIKVVYMDCPFTEIKENTFVNVHDLKKLELLQSKFETIPAAVSQLKKLKKLVVKTGELKNVTIELQNMTELVMISLEDNDINFISQDAFLGTVKLQNIILSRNKLSTLEPGIFDGCNHLLYIYLDKNYLLSADGLFNNQKLKVIDLRENKLKSIERIFDVDLSVTKLYLSGNHKLSNISVKAMSHNLNLLRQLYLNDCNLTSLSQHFLESFRYLEEINLSKNKLEVLPDGFFNSSKLLWKINLHHTSMTSLKNFFLGNDRLEKIDASNNYIETCENSFQNLTSLKNLNLKENKIQYIKKSDFESTPSLEVLVLSHNNINRIDRHAFSKLGQLRFLILDDNKLETLNETLKNMPCLKILSIRNNMLQSISIKGKVEFLNLPYIETLYLSGNKLFNVYGAFKNFYNLKYLEINDNYLTTLSSSTFPEKWKIVKIYSSGNNWMCDCRLLWLKERLEDNDFNCSHFFKPRKLSQISKDELVAYSKPDCPSNCTCTCVPDDDHYYIKVDCSKKRLIKVPPTILPEGIGELDLSHNHIKNPVIIKLRYKTNLRTLNLENNFLTEVNFHFPNNLSRLMLAGNQLTTFMEWPPVTIDYTLSENPWICDCETLKFRKWMISQSHKVLDVNQVRCGQENSLKGKVIVHLTEVQLCPALIKNYILMGAGAILVLILTVLSFLTYIRYRYHMKVWLYSRGFKFLKKRDDGNYGKLYDAYISFTDEDMKLVRNKILPELERKYPFYTLFVPQRDHKAENFEINDLLEQMMKSKKAIIFLSEDYVENEFCMEIFRVAYASSLEEKLYRIILVNLGDLPPLTELDKSLKIVIEASRCLNFKNKLFWEMLRYEMPVKLQDNTNNSNLHETENSEYIPLLRK